MNCIVGMTIIGFKCRECSVTVTQFYPVNMSHMEVLIVYCLPRNLEPVTVDTPIVVSRLHCVAEIQFLDLLISKCTFVPPHLCELFPTFVQKS